MSFRKEPSSVCIRDVLLDMRRCRMGLIQTADQLRFSYLAVIEGAKSIMGDTSIQESWKELSNEEDVPPEFIPPSPRSKDDQNGSPEHIHTNSEMRMRRRVVGDAPPAPPPRPPPPPQDIVSVAPPKPPRTPELEPELPHTHAHTQTHTPAPGPSAAPAWSPLANVCVCSALALGVYVCYRTWFH